MWLLFPSEVLWPPLFHDNICYSLWYLLLPGILFQCKIFILYKTFLIIWKIELYNCFTVTNLSPFDYFLLPLLQYFQLLNVFLHATSSTALDSWSLALICMIKSCERVSLIQLTTHMCPKSRCFWQNFNFSSPLSCDSIIMLRIFLGKWSLGLISQSIAMLKGALSHW